MINATGTTFLLLCCSAAAWLNTQHNTVFKDDNAPFFWNLWPPFAFFRAIYVLGAQCGRGECPETSDYDFSNEIVHIFLFLIFTSFFFYLLALYVDRPTPPVRQA